MVMPVAEESLSLTLASMLMTVLIYEEKANMCSTAIVDIARQMCMAEDQRVAGAAGGLQGGRTADTDAGQRAGQLTLLQKVLINSSLDQIPKLSVRPSF